MRAQCLVKGDTDDLVSEMRIWRDKMKGIVRLAGVSLVVLGLCLFLAAQVGAAGPPIITQAESQVAVLGDGGLDVKYRLTFHETEPRSGITTMGPLDAGHRMLDYHIEHEGRESPITLNSKGGGFYGADFGFNTRPGVDYTVQVHYQVPGALDQTTIDEVPYRVLEWSPIEWNLEIGEQIVTLILPVELPADVTQPEQVTDEIVDLSAIKIDEALVSSFDRWVYFPTPDETTGTNWLSIYVSKTDVPPQYHFRPKIYIPGQYFAGPIEAPATSAVDAPSVAAARTTDFAAPTEPEPAPQRALWPFIALFGLGGLGLAGAVVYLVFRWVSPKAAPEEYEAPEIEVETFEQPGLVPDLDAIEAAMYIGDTTKVITLVIMALDQRGVLTVLNRKPLQLEVTNPDLEMADYEWALVDGIADDGTLPQATVDRVLQKISARLQVKMWNADSEETRRTYRRKAADAWEDYRRLDPPRRWEWDHPRAPWVILAPDYRPYRPRPATS